MSVLANSKNAVIYGGNFVATTNNTTNNTHNTNSNNQYTNNYENAGNDYSQHHAGRDMTIMNGAQGQGRPYIPPPHGHNGYPTPPPDPSLIQGGGIRQTSGGHGYGRQTQYAPGVDALPRASVVNNHSGNRTTTTNRNIGNNYSTHVNAPLDATAQAALMSSLPLNPHAARALSSGPNSVPYHPTSRNEDDGSGAVPHSAQRLAHQSDGGTRNYHSNNNTTELNENHDNDYSITLNNTAANAPANGAASVVQAVANRPSMTNAQASQIRGDQVGSHVARVDHGTRPPTRPQTQPVQNPPAGGSPSSGESFLQTQSQRGATSQAPSVSGVSDATGDDTYAPIVKKRKRDRFLKLIGKN